MIAIEQVVAESRPEDIRVDRWSWRSPAPHCVCAPRLEAPDAAGAHADHGAVIRRQLKAFEGYLLRLLRGVG
jgi:hypothetical protein